MSQFNELYSLNILLNIVEGIPIRVFWKDCELRYLGCNTLFARDAGMSTPADLIGKTDFDMGWKDQAELYRADDMAVIQSGISKLDYEEPQTTPQGETIWLSTSKVPLRDNDGKIIGILGIYSDITERKNIEEKIFRLAHYDHITGLPNRRLFFDRLNQVIVQHKRQEKKQLFYLLTWMASNWSMTTLVT